MMGKGWHQKGRREPEQQGLCEAITMLGAAKHGNRVRVVCEVMLARSVEDSMVKSFGFRGSGA